MNGIETGRILHFVAVMPFRFPVTVALVQGAW
jgi:hypothetical protein